MSTMYSYSLNIINLESKKVTVLIDNAERTIDEISWPQKAKIVIRKIDSNYKPRAFFVDLDGKMEPTPPPPPPPPPPSPPPPPPPPPPFTSPPPPPPTPFYPPLLTPHPHPLPPS